MANNKPSRPSTLRSDVPAGSSGSKPKLLWLWVGLGAVVLLALGVAVLSSGDDEEVTVGSTVPAGGDGGASGGTGAPSASDGGDGAGATDTTAPAGGEIAEIWPVTITGTPLDPLPDTGTDPAVGKTAPGLSGFTFDGTPVEIDPSKGPVMLVFLAHWCPHCNREVPELNKWRDSGDVPEGLQVVAVTTAVSADREHYPPSTWIRDEMGWTWPVLADSPDNDAAIAFGVSGFPFSVILDTDGTVLGRSSGELGLDGIEAFVADSLAKAS